MPRKTHSGSRSLFIQKAKKLCQKEFVRWFKLTGEVNPLLRYFKEKDLNIPTLYVMGEEDTMFLTPVRKIAEVHKFAVLKIIDKCGHVVNVEQPDIFNQLSLNFLKSTNHTKPIISF